MTNETKYKPYSDSQERFGTKFIRRFGRMQVWVYEKTGGRLWSRFLGVECAILTTIGRKSGEPRKTPLLYLEDGDNVVMVASKGGMSGFPLWYLNMKANPKVTVQIKADKRELVAREATEEEAARLWPKLDALYPGFIEYRARLAEKGKRYAPVMIMEPEK